MDNYLCERICVIKITVIIEIRIINVIRFLWRYNAIKQICLAVNLKDLILDKSTVRNLTAKFRIVVRYSDWRSEGMVSIDNQ